jgi:hypothetical protein
MVMDEILLERGVLSGMMGLSFSNGSLIEY